MPSLLDSPPQLPAAGSWSSLYTVQEPVKPPRHLLVAPDSAAKKPAYGGRKKNLEMCTEALGCETGGVDAAAAEEVDDGSERKRRVREEVPEVEATEGRVRRAGRRGCVLPPPLTTLARGAGRVRMVHERRDGRLAVYAVRTPGMEAERSGGRLCLRLRLFPCGGGGGGNAAECNRQEYQEAEEEETEEADQEGEEEYGVAKYVRGGRCVEAEGGATAARRGKKKWEPEQAAAFWVATT